MENPLQTGPDPSSKQVPTVPAPEAAANTSSTLSTSAGNANAGGAGGGSGMTISAFRAADLKKALYDPHAKLVDLFGDLEPKLMLNSIMETFWEIWLKQQGFYI